jgi:hypothetical protein
MAQMMKFHPGNSAIKNVIPAVAKRRAAIRKECGNAWIPAPALGLIRGRRDDMLMRVFSSVYLPVQ